MDVSSKRRSLSQETVVTYVPQQLFLTLTKTFSLTVLPQLPELFPVRIEVEEKMPKLRSTLNCGNLDFTCRNLSYRRYWKHSLCVLTYRYTINPQPSFYPTTEQIILYLNNNNFQRYSHFFNSQATFTQLLPPLRERVTRGYCQQVCRPNIL